MTLRLTSATRSSMGVIGMFESPDNPPLESTGPGLDIRKEEKPEKSTKEPTVDCIKELAEDDIDEQKNDEKTAAGSSIPSWRRKAGQASRSIISGVQATSKNGLWDLFDPSEQFNSEKQTKKTLPPKILEPPRFLVSRQFPNLKIGSILTLPPEARKNRGVFVDPRIEPGAYGHPVLILGHHPQRNLRRVYIATCTSCGGFDPDSLALKNGDQRIADEHMKIDDGWEKYMGKEPKGLFLKGAVMNVNEKSIFKMPTYLRMIPLEIDYRGLATVGWLQDKIVQVSPTVIDQVMENLKKYNISKAPMTEMVSNILKAWSDHCEKREDKLKRSQAAASTREHEGTRESALALAQRVLNSHKEDRQVRNNPEQEVSPSQEDEISRPERSGSEIVVTSASSSGSHIVTTSASNEEPDRRSSSNRSSPPSSPSGQIQSHRSMSDKNWIESRRNNGSRRASVSPLVFGSASPSWRRQLFPPE